MTWFEPHHWIRNAIVALFVIVAAQGLGLACCALEGRTIVKTTQQVP